MRLESREAGLDVARRLAADKSAPAEVREVSRGILSAWGSPGAQAFLASLDAAGR